MKLIHLLLIVLMSVSCGKSKNNSTEDSGWKKHASNPVLSKGKPYGYDFYAISDCWVIADSGKYKLWYTAGGAVYPDTVLHNSIGYATSADGITWKKYAGNPVMDISKNGWDSLGVETVSVIIDREAPPASRYKMWYAGQTENEYRYQIGYATSADGLSWTKHPSPVLRVGNAQSWDNCFLEGPSVLKEGNVYKMWYAGYDCEVNGQPGDGKVNIGYATSADGIYWEKYAGNPVLITTKGEWDAVFVQDPHVIKHNALYHMWYGGTEVENNYFQQTGYAYSADGIHWVKSAKNPVIKRGSKGAWDANTSSFASVLVQDNVLRMWYTGKDQEPLPAWPQPYFWEIGYAEKRLPDDKTLD